jgi:CTD small phosphatase-like protein 2
MQTKNGFFIKDLRIIKNRDLKDMVIVDNLLHSFGLQIDNGIPILEFIDNKDDKELEHLEKYLIHIS